MKFIKTPEFITALCFFVFLALGIASKISIENVKFVQDGKAETASFPFVKNIEINKPFNMEFDIASHFDFAYDMWIVPDDCAEAIAIDGVEASLSDIQNRCSFSKGFVLADDFLAPYKHGGTTHYSLTLKNKGGPGGMALFIKMTSKIGWLINGLIFISLAMFFALLARRLRLGKTLIVLLFVGIVFRCFFFMATPYKKFSMDVEGHISYIQYVIENHSVPGNQECWSCYHPPVYYVSAVPSYLLSEFLGMPGTTGLQTFSLLLSVLTTFFGLLFLRKILEGRNLVLASVLWIFWPLMIMVAPRIGNDQLFYLLHVLCLWAGISYFKDGRGNYLIVAVVATALALWTKTTGVVTLGMLFVLMVGGFFAKGELRKPTRSEVVSWSLFIVLIAAFVLQKLLGSDLVGNADYLNSSMKVQNEAFNYLYFDLRSFLEYPWTSCWNSMMGRNFFWNFALKTSLFGEWDMLPTAEGRLCATIMSVLLLGLVVYGIRGFWKKRLDFVHWILFLQGIAFFGSLATLRLKYPFACSNDFRYILPVLLSIVPFVANGVTLKESSTIWKVGGYVIVLAFVVSSATLYIMVM